MATPVFDAAREGIGSGRSHWQTVRQLALHLWPAERIDLKIRVLAAMACLAAAKVIGVYTPFLYKRAVDALSPEQRILAVPFALVIAYGATRVLSQAFGELRDYLFAKVSQHAQRAVGLETFRHLHALSLAFHLERQTGGLSRVIERGVKGIQFVLSFMLFNILPTLLEIALVTGILAWNFGWPFAAVTFVTVSLYIVFSIVVTDWRLQYRRRMNQQDADANNKAVDSLLNFETVKYFGNEKHEFERYDAALAGYEREAVRSQSTLSLLNIGQGVIIGIGLILVMWLAADGVVARELTVGDFVLVNTYLIQLFLPLNFLGFVYREMKQGLVDMDKMFELTAIHPAIEDKPGAVELSIRGGEVEFADVSFAYRPDRPILKGVSFKAPPGRTIAIVGPSGAGKSTISRLLFRFYDVTSGAILIDGQDIRDVKQDSLRAAIGIVPQDTVLFNDTIGYNIRYGRPAATEEEVREAARLARIEDFTRSLPEAFETRVGERGLKLSGGEKQRVAIARTILKRPAVLLFDEATSALDSRTEKEIQASLREVSADRTTLVIAHRLSTVVDADEILVLKDGRIVERGQHHDLLRSGGEYAQMWRRQQEAEEAETKLKAALAES